MGLSLNNIKSGFRKTCIWPLDSTAMDEFIKLAAAYMDEDGISINQMPIPTDNIESHESNKHVENEHIDSNKDEDNEENEDYEDNPHFPKSDHTISHILDLDTVQEVDNTQQELGPQSFIVSGGRCYRQ